MALDDLNAEPIAKSAQAVAGQVRIGQTRKGAHVEKSGNVPGETGERIFTINDGKVIANIVPNHDRIVDALLESGDDVSEFRCAP